MTGNRSSATSGSPRFAELLGRTSFSFLEGASKPDEVVRTVLAAVDAIIKVA